jgi:hypothetical protein
MSVTIPTRLPIVFRDSQECFYRFIAYRLQLLAVCLLWLALCCHHVVTKIGLTFGWLLVIVVLLGRWGSA